MLAKTSSPGLRRPRRALALLGIAGIAALTLSACAPGSGAATQGAAGRLQIVATTSQVADFTRTVAGDSADVTQLIAANTSAHAYDPSAADLLALANADVVVINGAGLESWLKDAVEASGFDGVTIDAGSQVVLRGDHADHDRADHDHAEHEHVDGDHAEHEHADHEAEQESGGNPHIWTSVENAHTMVTTIAHGLADADLAHAQSYDDNATTYAHTLERLDDWIHASIDPVPTNERLLVSTHDVFTYFTQAYSITFVGAVIPSFDDNAETSAAQIDSLVDAVKATGAKAIFAEASVSPKAADTIAREAQVRVYSGADALYADSLGPAGSPGETYVRSQIHNVTKLVESWGYSPATLPDDLKR